MNRIFYTDGGCRPTNPGPGGYGWIEIKENKIIDYHFGYYDETTNNRMELQAILDILKFMDEEFPQDRVTIYSDSAYCVNIINEWMRSWAQNNWTRSKGAAIENLDIVKEIYYYYNKNFWNIQVEKCKGHCGDVYNDLVDALTWSEEKFLELANNKRVEIL